MYCHFRQFGVADSSDLWNNIQAAVNQSYPNALPEGLSVPLVMEAWELHAGYPVINVNRDYENKRIIITQVGIVNWYFYVPNLLLLLKYLVDIKYNSVMVKIL